MYNYFVCVFLFGKVIRKGFYRRHVAVKYQQQVEYQEGIAAWIEE